MREALIRYCTLFGSLALFLFFPAIAPMLAGSEIPPPSA